MLEKIQDATDSSLKYGKKLIRKKAIENIKEKLEFAQKKETDFTKEEMRKMIAKEENKILKGLGTKGALTAILAMFGIANFQMLKFFTKQFLYGRIYLWLKERIGGILMLVITLFLIVYIHNEYLKYVEYKTKFEKSYIGLSFVIKNILIIITAGSYFYFYFFLNKAKQTIKKVENVTSANNNKDKNDMVKSLDEFLNDEELK